MSGGETNGRWDGVERPYTREDVERIRGRFPIEHTVARLGAERLWQLLRTEEYVPALGALTTVDRRRARATALFLLGGTSELVTAVLDGTLKISRTRVVDLLTAMWTAVLADDS